MIKEWVFKNQKVTMCIAVVVLTYLCYQLSFKKTVAAMLLHQKLNTEVSSKDIGTQSTLAIMEQKQIAYTKILKSYGVKKEDRENTMWQTISGLALQHQVSISFQPPKLETDTAVVKNQFQQTFVFNGSYPNLVGLLAALHQVEQIGKVAKVKFFKDQKDEGNRQGLTMELSFVGFEK